MKTPLEKLLIQLRACKDARRWATGKEISEVVATCHRGDWLLWLAQGLDCDINLLTLAKVRSARTVQHLMKDKRSLAALDVAERFAMGEATKHELDAAASAAAAAYAASATSTSTATYSASAAAAAAAYATATATSTATAASSTATAAASSAANAAYASAASSASSAASSAANAAAASAVYAADARLQNQQETAAICRELLGKFIISEAKKRIIEREAWN